MREAAARVRVEGLREEVARLAEVLAAAEIQRDRRVIAREELVEDLAASAAETIAGTETEEKAVLSLPPVPGSTVPPWREGLPVTVLPPDCQRILGVLEQQRSTGHGPLRAKEIVAELGLGTTSAKVEGLRSKARRLAEARVAPPVGVGGVQCRPADRGRPRRRLIRVTIDHRTIASLVAGRVP